MSAETMEDMMRLRAALSASDKQTQTFLQPLLQLHGVQELLLTFVRDPSRSFEDWVWDPQVRQTLLHVRDANPQAHAQGQHLDEWYTRAVEERLQAQVLQNPDDDTPPEFLEDADKAQNDGKLKFKEKNYYAARNAFVRSIESVLKHQESEYYGKTVPASEWDDEVLRGRYVTLCNNVAICGIKMKELSLINEYATKALVVDEASSKALYAMAKLRLMEHRYKEAREVVVTALKFHPDKSQFLNLQKEIEAVERKQAMEQAEISEMRSQQVQRAIAGATTAKTVTQEDREQQLKDDMQKRVKTTPLPTREDDNFAAARLNVYFMKIKQRMLADIQPRYNADAGEEPLFECIIANATTGEVLATGVKGMSKKVVKNEACKVVIEKLWSDKLAAGTLTPDDLAYLERFESARDSDQPLVTEPAVPQKTDSSPQYPVRVSWLERQLQPLPLLNQLSHRGTIQTRFDIEDVSPNKEVTEFKCTGFLNGEQIATANAISKKKARVEVAKQVLAAAFEKNLLLVYDGPVDEEDDEVESKVHDEDEQTLARDSEHLDEPLSRLHPN